MSDVRGHDEVARHCDRAAGDGAPSVPDGEHVEDLAAGYALDALDPAECAAVERHLRACAHCAILVAAEQRAVGLLAYAAPPAQPDPGAKAELFTRIAHVERAAASVPARTSRRWLPPTVTIPASRPLPAAPLATVPAWFDRPVERRPERQGWTSWAGAILTVPLLVALAATGTWAMQLRAEVDERGDRMNGLETLLDGAFADATDVASIYQLSPGLAAKEAKGWIATDTGQRTVAFYMKNDDARPGQTYELLGSAEGQTVRLAEVTLDERGRATTTFEINRPLTEYRVVRVKATTPDGGESDGGEGGLALWGHIDGTSDLRQDVPDKSPS